MIMKKIFAVSLFLFFCVKGYGQIIVNADGTHSILTGSHIINSNGTVSVQHGSHIVNSDGTVSVQHGSVIVNTNGRHSIILGPPKEDNNNQPLDPLTNNKQRKNQQLYFKGRMNDITSGLDRFDVKRKAKKEERRKK